MKPSPMALTEFPEIDWNRSWCNTWQFVTFKNLIHRTSVEQVVILQFFYTFEPRKAVLQPKTSREIHLFGQGASPLYVSVCFFRVFFPQVAAPSLDTTSPKFPEAWSRTWLCTLWTSSFAPVWSWKLQPSPRFKSRERGGHPKLPETKLKKDVWRVVSTKPSCCNWQVNKFKHSYIKGGRQIHCRRDEQSLDYKFWWNHCWAKGIFAGRIKQWKIYKSFNRSPFRVIYGLLTIQFNKKSKKNWMVNNHVGCQRPHNPSTIIQHLGWYHLTPW